MFYKIYYISFDYLSQSLLSYVNIRKTAYLAANSQYLRKTFRVRQLAAAHLAYLDAIQFFAGAKRHLTRISRCARPGGGEGSSSLG